MQMTSLSTRRLISLISASALVAAMAVATVPAVASAAVPPAPYFNGFENTVDTDGLTNQSMFGVSQVATGPGAITSATGTYHALAATTSGAFTRYGGYSSTFPADGYTTSADIYLDTAVSTPGSDLRFDWSSAINKPDGTFLRDFVFNVGTNGNAGFIMSASNNAGRDSSYPANPDRSPITILATGWYTFQHHFYVNGTGVLAADLTVRALGSTTVLGTWTLSDPLDAIGSVGGNRYGWLVNNELPLALDNITRSGILPKCAATGFIRDGIDLTAAQIGGAVTGSLDATTCNIGAYFDAAHPGSVAGATVFGANYFGVVANGVALSVTNSTIRNIGETPLNGSQHGNAVVYINGASGTISGNSISSYQKNGITVSGKAADGVTAGPKTSASVLNNVVTGQGPITYIAQNGIQISYGATATVKGNTVSGDNYTPTSYVACGLLVYQAGGVSASSNTLFNNERNQCNFGKGGGQFNP
jgi:hypothetical protein